MGVGNAQCMLCSSSLCHEDSEGESGLWLVEPDISFAHDLWHLLPHESYLLTGGCLKAEWAVT